MHVSASVFLCEVIYYSRGSLTLATHMCTTHFLRCSSLFTPFFSSSFSSSPLYINRHQERKGFSRICVSNMHRHLLCILSLCVSSLTKSVLRWRISLMFLREGIMTKTKEMERWWGWKWKWMLLFREWSRRVKEDDDDETGEKSEIQRLCLKLCLISWSLFSLILFSSSSLESCTLFFHFCFWSSCKTNEEQSQTDTKNMRHRQRCTHEHQPGMRHL